MTSRSHRSTGVYRAFRGSGCVGILPASKPGNPHKLRRKTKPLRRPACHKPKQAESVVRGRKKQHALVERAWMVRHNPIAHAVRWALGK